MRGKILGHLAAIFVVTAWGTSFIATKALMEDASCTPVEVYIYRFALAYLLVLCLTFKKIFCNSIRDELQLLMCGVCAGSMFFILENTALQYTTTGNVSLLSCMSPMITAALMALFYRLRIGVGLIIGSLIAFVGVVCIIFSHGEGFEINPMGDLLALSSSFVWALYAVGVKRLIPVYTSLFITRKLFFYGVLTALPLLLISHGDTHLGAIFTNATYLLNLLFLVVACSVLAYLLFNYAMKSLGSVTANNYLYMQPLITMVVGYFVLGETITLPGYIGCVLIIGGLIISDKLKVKRSLHQVRK